MKMYNKPEIFVTEFEANDVIAKCEVTYSVKNNQVIDCFADGSTTVFFSGCGNNDITAEENQTAYKTYILNDADITWSDGTVYGSSPTVDWETHDNGKYYFAWVDSKADEKGGDASKRDHYASLMDTIAKACGFDKSYGFDDDQVLHAGFIDYTVITGNPS